MTPVTLDTWLRYQHRNTWNDTQHSAPELSPSVKDASPSEDPSPRDSEGLPSSGRPRRALAAGEPLPCLAVQPPPKSCWGARRADPRRLRAPTHSCWAARWLKT